MCNPSEYILNLNVFKTLSIDLARYEHDLTNEHDNPFIHEILTTGIKVA